MCVLERPSTVAAEDPLEEGKEQGDDTEVKTLSRGRQPSRQPIMYTQSEKEYSEVLVELADTAVDPNSVKELIDCVVENVERIIVEQQLMSSDQVQSIWTVVK
ncbi:hypothetical protein AXG93_2156s1000 [Marchantia polymorpha subsp. ruderalis]|uniref:Uncharacterized protein n=1 Tax=Marchantia polymorpha subsp. ruderalis TaxID=1480154 RepID=A0A176VGZ8_MARPO|nr:hypothetical protein AXG93_2156s1000 [Marchantia polymorpha subsp. ruderalis]